MKIISKFKKGKTVKEEADCWNDALVIIENIIYTEDIDNIKSITMSGE